MTTLAAILVLQILPKISDFEKVKKFKCLFPFSKIKKPTKKSSAKAVNRRKGTYIWMRWLSEWDCAVYSAHFPRKACLMRDMFTINSM